MAKKTQKRSSSSIRAQRRKKHRRQKRQRRMVISGAILLLLAILYLVGVIFFRNRFLPNTVINNIECSGKTVDQSKDVFHEMASEYVLVLTERDEGSEEIKGSDIALDVNPGTSLDEILSAQKPFSWVTHLFSGQEETIETAVSYDAALLEEVLSSLNCTDESLMYDSEDAHLSEYMAGSGYEMVEEVYGTRIQEDVFLESVDAAILAFEDELNLAESGCYVDPVYTADSEAAQTMLSTANKYVNTTITYEFGDDSEVLDGSQISQWILVADDLTVSLDEEQEAAYVSDLADTYDTKWQSRTLVSHSGETVTVPAGGNYGWRLNQDDTLAALQEYLESGEDYTGEVVWYQTTAQYGDQDYGTTYIEVSISAQHF
ncbi:MAG: peptidoglycan binding domain-containing protein [Clostridiales bacterium]|nr:peptidoglycan binding domain-containing protein [Clostridiales bacterium]